MVHPDYGLLLELHALTLVAHSWYGHQLNCSQNNISMHLQVLVVALFIMETVQQLPVLLCLES